MTHIMKFLGIPTCRIFYSRGSLVFSVAFTCTVVGTEAILSFPFHLASCVNDLEGENRAGENQCSVMFAGSKFI